MVQQQDRKLDDGLSAAGGLGMGAGGGGGRLYNPYNDLPVPVDRRHLQSVYTLPSAPEFLFHEEAANQRRNWSENLTYYTGCAYLAGAVSGGSVGFFQGVRAAEVGDTTKLRINRVLNASGHQGRSYGNTLGILGLLFAGLESSIVAYRGADDMLNPIAAGLGTGMLYKVAAGPRAAALAGAIGGLTAGGFVAGKQALKRYVPI